MYRASQDPGPILVVATRADVQGIDRRTGATVWRHVPAISTTAWQRSIPRLVVEGESVITCSLGPLPSGLFGPGRVCASVTCLDYRSGRRRWEQEIVIERSGVTTIPTLLIDAGQVLVALPQRVYAYGLENGAPQWQRVDLWDSMALAVPGAAVQIDVQD